MNRRWRWVGVSPLDIVSLFVACKNRPAVVTLELWDGTPALILSGYDPGDVQYDFLRRLFLIRVTHPSFDEVPPGAETPFGGCGRLRLVPVDDVHEVLSKMLDERDAIIHDLREQLAGRGS